MFQRAEFLPEMRRARFLGTDFSKHIPNWLYDVTAIRGKNGPFVATNFSTTEIQGLGLQLQIARIDQIIEARRRASGISDKAPFRLRRSDPAGSGQ